MNQFDWSNKVVRRFDVPNVPAIYAITSGEEVVYCGASREVASRISAHHWNLSRGRHPSNRLQAHFDSCGLESFGFKILEYVNIEALGARERYWTGTFTGLLNSRPLGAEWSEEEKVKTSEALKGWRKTDDRARIDTERCLKNSKAVQERARVDPEFKRKLEANRQKGVARIKERHKDPEFAKAHSDALRKRWADPEYKAKLSAKLKEAWARKKLEQKEPI